MRPAALFGYLSAALILLLQQPVLARSSEELNQEIATTRAVQEISLAPDGKTVAAVIAESTAEGGQPHIWLLAPGKAPRQLTGKNADNGQDDTSSEQHPAWSQDGQSLFYLEKSGSSAEIRRIGLRSGHVETLALSHQGGEVQSSWASKTVDGQLNAKGFSVSPTGALAVWASDPSDAKEKAASKQDHYYFGTADPVGLFIIGEGTAARLVSFPQNIRNVRWSDDGTQLLVVTTPETDDLGEQNRLWLIEGNKTPREIVGTAENVQAASWLPDGRLAYFARCKQDAPIVCRDLFVQALDGSPPVDLTDGIEGSLMVSSAVTPGPLLTKSGDILITIAQSFDQHLARIRPSDGRITYVNSLPAVVQAVTSNDRHDGFALLAAERGDVPRVLLADPALHDHETIKTPPLRPDDWPALSPHRLEWKSDDLAIEGLLYLPEGAAPAMRVPLVVDVHGGPAGRFEDIDYPLVRLLLNEGWAVLRVNPRGSFGYGTQFLASLKNDIGGGDYRDIMAGIDAAIAQAPIDPEQLALIGYSYGGTMASFTVGRTDRFKAFIAAAPVIDQFSEYGTEESSWYDRWYFGQPWRRVEDAWRQSPLSGVANASTPMLLVQGEEDDIDPPGQSYEFYRALRQEGSPVELLMLPRESHHELGQNFYGFPSVEPHHGIAMREKMLNFLRAGFANDRAAKPDD